MSVITTEEFHAIARDLEEHHAIFTRLWQTGRPVEDKSIQTACVRWDKKGNFLAFCFNPDFYKSLDDYNKRFVICHEMLHLILEHPKRCMDLNLEVANVATDIVINESLIKNFKFQKDKIQNWKDFCWYETVFKKSDIIQEEKAFEYYYDKLLENSKQIPMGGSGKGKGQGGGANGPCKCVDEHTGFGSEKDGTSGHHQNEINEQIENAADGLSSEELDKLAKSIEKIIDEEGVEGGQQAGSIGGHLSKIMSSSPVAKKRKWETIIKNWALKQMKNTDKVHEQWARTNRRFVFVDKRLFIPTEMETDERDMEKDKILVYMFLDTSGSCAHLAPRFWRAAKSLPENKFKLKLYCFDTSVYEVDISKRQLYGFGGTSFEILEQRIQQEIKTEGVKYPDAVFVITDGYGDYIKPEKPKNWHWFLTNHFTDYIDKNCKIYQLSKFE